MMTRRAKRREIENGRLDWAGLPDGIVDSIADLLLKEDVTHYIRLRCVCASWRSATLNPAVTDPRFLPRNWLLVSKQNQPRNWLSKQNHHRPKTPWRFLNLSTGKYIRAKVPELAGRGGRTLLRVVDGLLVFIDGPSHVIHLLNPFTGALACFLPLNDGRDYLTNFAPSQHEDIKIVLLNNFVGVNFAISSSSSSVVVVISFIRRLAYAKLGDTKWSFFDLERSSVQSFQDRLYSLSLEEGPLLRFEPDQNRFITLYPSLPELPPWDPRYVPHMKGCFHVVSDGEMLVVRHYEQDFDYYFKVFKLDLENGTLVPKRSIGERALFINDEKRAFSVSTSTFPSIVPGSIYYTFYKYRTNVYHPIDCACHPKSKRFLTTAGPESWIDVGEFCKSRGVASQLHLYYTTY
ncbi:hypothetical protein LUZ60_008558 [Juncus effusus]|nr:hypothetical protein LUZ60_008558 [Juncus effusus]